MSFHDVYNNFKVVLDSIVHLLIRKSSNSGPLNIIKNVAE